MQSSLWKLGALLGVIGSGFFVLMEAQNGVTTGEVADAQFNELDAIGELDRLGEASELPEPQTEEQSAQLALADTYGAEAKPTRTAAPAQVEPTPTGQSEPTPTPAESEQSEPATTPVAAESHSANPFAAFDFRSASESEPESQAEPKPEVASAASEENEVDPFADLMRKISAKADEPKTSEPAESTEVVKETPEPPEHLESHETNVAVMPAAEPISPFGSQEEPTIELAANEEPAPSDEEPAPSEEAPVSSPPLETRLELIPDDADAFDSIFPPADVAMSHPAPKQFEPTSLKALPPGAPGPTLMTPPPTAAESGVPPQQADPAVYEVATEENSTATDEIVQIGAEQPAPWEANPTPELVFPGAEPPPQEEPARMTRNPRPTLPSVEARGQVGTAWAGDDSPTTTPRDRVVHSDGTVEMTIKPREEEDSPASPNQQDQHLAQLSQDGFNPFATAPEQPAPRERAQQSEPAPIEIAPDHNERSLPQRFPDPGLSFSKGPIQPSGAELPTPQSRPTNPLTPADFVGVGTVSQDMPSTPQQAQLTIEKQAPNDAVLGKDLIYSILVKNIGRSPANNVVVEDLVPKGTELKGTDPQAQMTQDKKLVWQLGSMESGAQRTIRIKVVPKEAGQIGSVATVSFEAAVASRTVITAPELKLAMSGPTEVRVGEKAPYRFTLTNTGSADASHVFIRSIIPAGFEHPASRQENGITDIEYEVGDIPRGQSKDIELTLLAVAPGEFQNHAILTAEGNVNVESKQPVNIITSRLKIEREGPANRFVGGEARFTNSVSNGSSQPLQNVTVTESVPPGVKFVSASDGGHFDAQQRTITWRLNELEPGGVRQLQTVIVAEQSGQFATTIQAANQRGDQADAESELMVAGFSSLTVDVDNPGRPIAIGEEVALRLKVRNRGTAAANAVETRIQLPKQLRFVSAKGPVRYAQQGEWIAFEAIDRIDVEGEQTFDVILAAAEVTNDARVVVQLSSKELTRPLNEDESVVIYNDR